MQKALRNSNDKAHAKSFSSQISQKMPKKVVEPLTRAFFTQLIKLETDFYNKQYTAQSLDELTQLYAKAVEYYDMVKDEITSYFIYKIQDALASKKSLKILMDQTAKEALRKSTLVSSDVIPEGNSSPKIEELDVKNEVIQENASEDEENSEDEDDVNIKEFEKKRKAYLGKKANRTNQASFSTMRNQKQKFVHFFHKMEVQKAQQKQSLNTLINDYNSCATSNDQTVKVDLSTQKERLRAAIEQRKQKSLMAHTLNASSQFMALRTSMQSDSRSQVKRDNDTNRLEDVLKGLEEDDAQFEAAGLLIAGQPNQSEEDQANDEDLKSVTEKTPRDIVQNLKEGSDKYSIFKIEALELAQPARVGDFEDRSNTDAGSFAFLSPRDNNEAKSSKVLSEDSNKVADGGSEIPQNAAQPIEADNVN